MYLLLLLVFLPVLLPGSATAQVAAERWRIPSVRISEPPPAGTDKYLVGRNMIIHGAPGRTPDIIYVDTRQGIRAIIPDVVDYRYLKHEDGLYALRQDGAVCYVDDATQTVRILGRVPVGAELMDIDEASRIVVCRKDPMLYVVYDDGESPMKELRFEPPYGDDKLALMDGGRRVLHVQGFSGVDTIPPRVITYDVESGLTISDVAAPSTATSYYVVSKRTAMVGDSTFLDLTNGTFFARSKGIVSELLLDTVHVGLDFSDPDALIVKACIDTARGPMPVYHLSTPARTYREFYVRDGSFHVIADDRYWIIDVAKNAIVDSGRNHVNMFMPRAVAVSGDGTVGVYAQYMEKYGDKLYVVDRIGRRILDSIPGIFMPRATTCHIEGDTLVAWYDDGIARVPRNTLRNDRVVRRFDRHTLRHVKYLGDGRSLCFVDSAGTIALVSSGSEPIACPPLMTFIDGRVNVDNHAILDPEGGQLHLTAMGYMNVDIPTQTTSEHRWYKDSLAAMREQNWRFQVVGTGGDTLVAICPGCAEPYGSQIRIIGPEGMDSVDLGEPVSGMRIRDNRTPRAVVMMPTKVDGIRIVDAIARKVYPGPQVLAVKSSRACEDGSGLVIEYANGDSLMLYDFRESAVLWKGRLPLDTRYTAPDASAIVIAHRVYDTVRVVRYRHGGDSVQVGPPVIVPESAYYTVSGNADAIIYYHHDTIHRIDLPDRTVIAHRMEMPFRNGNISDFITDRHGRTAFFSYTGPIGQGEDRYQSFISVLDFSNGRGYLMPSLFRADVPRVVGAVPAPIVVGESAGSNMIGVDGRILGCYPSYVRARLENGNLLCSRYGSTDNTMMIEYSTDKLSWSGQEYARRMVGVVDYGGSPVAIADNGAAVVSVVGPTMKGSCYYRSSPDAEGLYLGTEFVSASPSLDYVFTRLGDTVSCHRTRDGAVMHRERSGSFGRVRQWVDHHSVMIVRDTDVRLLDLDPDATDVAAESKDDRTSMDGGRMTERAFDLLGREVGMDTSGLRIVVGTDTSGRTITRKILVR